MACDVTKRGRWRVWRVSLIASFYVLYFYICHRIFFSGFPLDRFSQIKRPNFNLKESPCSAEAKLSWPLKRETTSTNARTFIVNCGSIRLLFPRHYLQQQRNEVSNILFDDFALTLTVICPPKPDQRGSKGSRVNTTPERISAQRHPQRGKHKSRAYRIRRVLS